MSATVTYKGETLTTISNTTKKLLTAGKYMEDDVTITDDSRTIIPLGVAISTYTYSSLDFSWASLAEVSP